ncbi:MAG: hypothetical protein IJV15_05385 [Lachnospiraceae bacterium]|nr:hypothetical protein [Lachnospiraceae bacterium]
MKRYDKNSVLKIIINATYISQGYKINDMPEEIKAKIDIGNSTDKAML